MSGDLGGRKALVIPNDAIAPFTLAVPQADLEDLNRRIDQILPHGRAGSGAKKPTPGHYVEQRNPS